MGKFSDSPYFILSDFVKKIAPVNATRPKKGILRGPCRTMAARFGSGIDIFLKAEDGFKRIRGVPLDGQPEGNYFNFHMPTNTYRQSDITWYDLDGYSGYECYFRKDVLFHEFVDNHPEWEHFVNTNKVFLYFGKIYPTEYGNFCVVFDGMKDYVVNALPANNRTDNMVEFLSVFFDRVYQEPYNRIKNVWTQSDPREVEDNYIYYIANMYNMIIPEGLDVAKQRLYVDGLPGLLKRKGTYASLYIMWKNIISKTTNYLNIYERWHDVIDPEDIPLPYFEDVIYTMNPDYGSHFSLPTDGAGVGFYYSPEVTGSGYPSVYSHDLPDGKILSPHYRIEIDLSNEPLGDTYIIDEATWSSLRKGWESMRPVVRYSHYSQVLAPITDFTGRLVSLYGAGNLAFCLSRSLRPFGTDPSLIGKVFLYTRQSASEFWIVDHDLNSANVIVQCYDTDGNMVFPDSVQYRTMDSVRIEWKKPVAGYCTVSLPDYVHSQVTSAATLWNMTHSLVDQYPIVHFTDDSRSQFIPLTVKAEDDNTMSVTFAYDVMGYGLAIVAEYRHIQSTAASEWHIIHGLDSAAVQIQVYDENDEVMYPDEARPTGPYDVYLKFAYPVTGKAVIKKVGRSLFDMEDLATSITYAKIGDGEDTRHFDPFGPSVGKGRKGDIKREIVTLPLTRREDAEYYYYLINIGRTEVDYNITEIGLFGYTEEAGDDSLVFYTTNSPLYKPKDVTMKIFYRAQKRI